MQQHVMDTATVPTSSSGRVFLPETKEYDHDQWRRVSTGTELSPQPLIAAM